MPRRDWICFAAAAWLIGVAALCFDHLQVIRPIIIGMHTLVAGATSGAIAMILITGALESGSRAELYLLTRLVSRWVYILMYLLAIVRVGLYLYESGAQCALSCGPRSPPPVRAMDDFQFYICCCVIPLWVVRAAVLAGLKPVPILFYVNKRRALRRARRIHTSAPAA